MVFSVYSTNKTDRHDITERLLKVALNTITPQVSLLNPTMNLTFLAQNVMLCEVLSFNVVMTSKLSTLQELFPFPCVGNSVCSHHMKAIVVYSYFCYFLKQPHWMKIVTVFFF
jgi:hypothetical protein